MTCPTTRCMSKITPALAAIHAPNLSRRTPLTNAPDGGQSMKRPSVASTFRPQRHNDVTIDTMENENTVTQQGFTLWLTGLSGAGKTTIALELEQQLRERGLFIERLDGDTVREGLTRDLGFSKADRDKNIERVSFVAKLLSRNGVGVIASFISPYREARQNVREQTTNFIEVYVSAPLEVLIQRDVKGLYVKA